MPCCVRCNVIFCGLFAQFVVERAQKVHELETRVILLDHQQQMSKLLLQEKERLVEQLQRELLEVKSERDDLR